MAEAHAGLRIGTVRRPPRGVPRPKFSSGNWYDVWIPNLAPLPETVKLGLGAKSQREWGTFVKRYRAEMASSASYFATEEPRSYE